MESINSRERLEQTHRVLCSLNINDAKMIICTVSQLLKLWIIIVDFLGR